MSTVSHLPTRFEAWMLLLACALGLFSTVCIRSAQADEFKMEEPYKRLNSLVNRFDSDSKTLWDDIQTISEAESKIRFSNLKREARAIYTMASLRAKHTSVIREDLLVSVFEKTDWTTRFFFDQLTENKTFKRRKADVCSSDFGAVRRFLRGERSDLTGVDFDF